MDKKVTIEGVRDHFMTIAQLNKTIQEDHRRDLSPIPVYVDSIMPIQKRMADILPKKGVCDRLLDTYFATSETLYRVMHRPSFMGDYEQFWSGDMSKDYFLPLLLCMMSIGSRFEAKSAGLGQTTISDGVHIPTACALVRSWLDSLRGKQLAEVYTLQCEILLLHTQRLISQRPHDAWTQLGLIVRMAMTMGMHREPSEFQGLGPFCCEMRRRIWYTILDIDLHVSLASNLPCGVREGDFTTRPPNNLNDDEMYYGMKTIPEGKPIDVFTDCQLQAYAARTILHRMRVVNLLCRIDSVRDYAEVLEVGTRLERHLEDINYLFPRNLPVHDRQSAKMWRLRIILDMHCRRPLLALYRPFALSSPPDAPPQLWRSYLRSSMILLGYPDEVDRNSSQYQNVSDMYHVILKQDIIQAAFSVCYYLKVAQESLRSGGIGVGACAPFSSSSGGANAAGFRSSSVSHPAWGPSPPDSCAPGTTNPGAEQPDYGDILAPENSLAMSPARLTAQLQRTLDGLICRIHDLSTELKEVVMLAVIFASVKTNTQDEMVDEVKRSLRRILDAYPLPLPQPQTVDSLQQQIQVRTLYVSSRSLLFR